MRRIPTTSLRSTLLALLLTLCLALPALAAQKEGLLLVWPSAPACPRPSPP